MGLPSEKGLKFMWCQVFPPDMIVERQMVTSDGQAPGYVHNPTSRLLGENLEDIFMHMNWKDNDFHLYTRSPSGDLVEGMGDSSSETSERGIGSSNRSEASDRPEWDFLQKGLKFMWCQVFPPDMIVERQMVTSDGTSHTFLRAARMNPFGRA